MSGEEFDIFNQAPSLSTRLLASIEERFLGACSIMEAMLPALRDRCDVRTGGEPILITEEMLLFTEWFLLVLKDPSDEIVESGLGMISTFSEKPTQRREPGLIGEDSRELVSVSSVEAMRSSVGAVACSSAGWPNGVLGRLVLSLGEGSAEGTIMLLMSWLESAAERRCACPRLPVFPGIGRALLGSGTSNAVGLVGLVLSALDNPNLESPPTNSLVPLLCPLRGVNGSGASAVGSIDVSCKPEVLSALKEKLGSAEVVLLWAAVLLLALTGCAPGTPRCIDIGRRREGAGPIWPFEGLGVRGCMGNEKVGLGTISNLGSVRATCPDMIFEMLLACLW